MEIPVTYQCWGCGSQVTVYEETDIPVPSMTKWNLCNDCKGDNDVSRSNDRAVEEGHNQKVGA